MATREQRRTDGRVSPVMNETPLSLLERLRHGQDDPSWQRLSELYLPLLRGWLSQHGLPATMPTI